MKLTPADRDAFQRVLDWIEEAPREERQVAITLGAGRRWCVELGSLGGRASDGSIATIVMFGTASRLDAALDDALEEARR